MGSHIWCDHRNVVEDHKHDDNVPYCYASVAKVQLIPEPGHSKSAVFVYATSTAHPNVLVSGEQDGEPHDGIELAIETWAGKGSKWTEQKIHITSDAARSLAAALTRAADIE
jgi:hypothetical protein